MSVLPGQCADFGIVDDVAFPSLGVCKRVGGFKNGDSGGAPANRNEVTKSGTTDP